MKNRVLSFLLVLTALLCCQCTSRNDGDQADIRPDYNEYVSGFTSGTISRQGEVRVLLANDIPQSRIDSLNTDDLLRITPKVPGHVSFADLHTLVFVPSEEMEVDARYEAEVNLKALVGADEPFKFSFRTRPFAIDASMKSFDVTDDGLYEITFQLRTADNEPSDKIESLIATSIAGSCSWLHTGGGIEHLYTFRTQPTTDTRLVITAKADRKGKSGSQEVFSIDLPSTKSFSLVNIESHAGESNTITATFNKNIDPAQNTEGLVYIDNVQTSTFVQGNKIVISGALAVGRSYQVHIDKNLRSVDHLTINPNHTVQGVEISADKPEVKFLGDGTIIPLSDKIIIPFSAVYTRGVRVTVFKIYGNMIGTMLQHGDIDRYHEIRYAGRPILATTIFVDDKGADLSKWHNYALDLTHLVRLDPGAMYRVELGLDARLSAWPCDSLPHATREEMEAEDARIMDKLSNSFDNEHYYYTTGSEYMSEEWWTRNYYKLHQDPSSKHYYNDRFVGKNVLATNIGLTYLHGKGNTINVSALNLPDASPLEGVSIETYNYQQQLNGSARTNSEGVASLDYNEKMGKPAYVIARKGDDISYLNVGIESAISTSNFDVYGSFVERGLKGYIYGERGVWRPGDTLHIAFMLNDQHKTLPANHPVTLKLSNPLGQLTNQYTRTSGVMGIYSFDIPTPADAPTGIWTAKVNVGGVSFHKNLRIETIKPNRLKVDLKLPGSTLSTGNISAQLHTEWLNGNIARSLRYDIAATIIATETSFKGYDGYVFDDPTKSFEKAETNLAKGETDGSGDANPHFSFNVTQKAPGMLKGSLVTHVYEPSGEFSVDVSQTLISPYSRFVGIKSPMKRDQTHLDTDKDHTFEVACVNQNGNAVGVSNVDLKVDVYKVDWYWWWSSSNDRLAGYTTSSHNTPVKSFSLNTDDAGRASFTLNMREANWGTYLIVVNDKEKGHSAGILSYFDWPWMTSRTSDNDGDNATSLSVSTDKKEYAPGETMHVTIPSDAGSRAIISLSNGSRVLHFQTYPCKEQRTVIDIPITEEMTPNVYVAASLVQPYQQTLNDMPIRLFGLIPISVISPRSHLHPQVSSPEEIMPETQCQITVSEKDGRPMGYTLAVVDEGLLDLTRFKTPNAWDTFNAREGLGVRFWDLYRHVNGAFGGHIEQLFSIGGDEALNNTPKATVNRFRPMVYFAGPFQLKKGEKRVHKVNVPNYNGRVRVMVVAGDGSAYGNADRSMLVRRPLMMLGTMPRQIGANDEMTVSATVFATRKLDDVRISIQTGHGLEVMGNNTSSVSFGAPGDQTVQFRIKAGSHTDHGTVSLKAVSGSFTADYTTDIKVRTVSQTISRTDVASIEAGMQFNKDLVMPGDEDYRLLVDVSAVKPLNLSNRINQLIAYPHGCVEQTTSKAFPQLYLPEYSMLSDDEKKEVENNVKYTISRLASYVTPDGGMSYWPGGNQPSEWASAYVHLFLHEAESRGYYVQKEMKQRLTAYLSGKAGAWSSSTGSLDTWSFVLYSLAATQHAQLGAMNRMREHAAELSPVAIRLLAAAYANAGRADIGKELLLAPAGKSTHFFVHDDLALFMAHLALDDPQSSASAENIRKALVSDDHLSTIRTSLSIVQLASYYKRHNVGSGLDFTYSLAGKKVADVKGNTYTWTNSMAVDAKSRLELANHSQAPMFITYTMQGVAKQSKIERASNGLELAIRYTSDTDQPLNVASLAHSTTFKACVTVRNISGKDQDNIAVTHIIPAGWEILSSQAGGTIHYQDRRDDRLLSYIDRLRNGESITITVQLSATYCGNYYVPSVQTEAMYDASVSGWTESDECVVK